MILTDFRLGNLIYLSDKKEAEGIANQRLLENINKLSPVSITAERLVKYGFKFISPNFYYRDQIRIFINENKFFIEDEFEVMYIHDLQNLLKDKYEITLKTPLI